MKAQHLVIWQKAQDNMIANIKNSGIPLSQLADLSGVSVTTLRNIINKKTVLRAPNLIKISKALNLSVDDFVGLKDL